MTKTCKSCGLPKPLEDFYSAGPGRKRADCRLCSLTSHIRSIPPDERAEIVRRFDDGQSIEDIRRALKRSAEKVRYVLMDAGRDTARHGRCFPREPGSDDPIGTLAAGHKLAWLDELIMAARERPAEANPWPTRSSLA